MRRHGSHVNEINQRTTNNELCRLHDFRDGLGFFPTQSLEARELGQVRVFYMTKWKIFPKKETPRLSLLSPSSALVKPVSRKRGAERVCWYPYSTAHQALGTHSYLLRSTSIFTSFLYQSTSAWERIDQDLVIKIGRIVSNTALQVI
jgi:hypothetical protein